MDRDNYSHPQILHPHERLKALTKNTTTLVIDSNIPPRRYFRSGVEMVRMAQVYLDEGKIENAYILYLKFMTLFIEKIRSHPEYENVPASVKVDNKKYLREVIPVAEKLKKTLFEQYKSEYEEYKVHLEERKRLLEEAARRKQIQMAKAKAVDKAEIPPHLPDYYQRTTVYPVPPLLNDLNYPDFASPEAGPADITAPPQSPPKPSPDFDRSTKPSSITTYIPPSPSRSEGLRRVTIPENLTSEFLIIAKWNTDRNIETCGILAGKLKHDQLVISHLLVPAQSGTADSCTTQREEDLFDYQDQHDLITIGWIHTHPSQTAFLSSVDLHTHYSYQRMMPEAIAIVCAPRYNESKSFFLTPHYGLSFIGSCQKHGFHPHPSDSPLFMETEHSKIVGGVSVQIVDLLFQV